jgi:hypothetical protein
MKRVVTALAAMLGATALVPGIASAANIQVGVTSTPLLAPTCPADAQGNSCRIVLTQVTAYETLRDGVSNPDIVKHSGEISAFSLGLSSTTTVTTKDISYLSKLYGGPPEAQLTILRSVGTAAGRVFRVAAQSPVFKLQSEFGQVAEFPLVAPLPVVRGEMLAVTVPTWAPVLSFELDTTKFSYVQSRSPVATTTATSSCNNPIKANLAQIILGQLSNYSCRFPGTRVEYSALEITTPAGFSSAARRHKPAARQRSIIGRLR